MVRLPRRSPSTPNIGAASVPMYCNEPKIVSSRTEPVLTMTYQLRMSVSISNAHDVRRSAGHWKRKLRTRNAASIVDRGSWRYLRDLIALNRRFVELEPEPGPLRRDQLALLDSRHLPEDACRSWDVFDLVTDGNGRQEMHLNLGHDVPAHRNPMRLREGRDLAPGRDATDPREVEDDEIHGSRLHQHAKRIEMIEMLASRDRHGELPAELGESGHVEMVDRIL